MQRFRFSGDQRRRTAPAFRLAAAGDGTIALADFRGRSNLVIAFLQGLDAGARRQALDAFRQRQKEYRAEDAQVLALVERPPEEAPGPEQGTDGAFPLLLADPGGSTRREYAGLLPEEPQPGQALFFVLDRFGAPHVAYASSRPADPDLHQKILSWLLGIELECPE